MQKILENSYINVIRFWRRVEKECNRCSKLVPCHRQEARLKDIKLANRIGRALASFSTSKLDDIIKSMNLDASECRGFVPIVQERLQRGEREDAAEERRLAGIAREEQGAFIKQQQEERRLQTKRKILTAFCYLKAYYSCRNSTKRRAWIASGALKCVE